MNANTWYSISTSKWDPETKTSQQGLFVEKVKVIKESEKFITVERTLTDGMLHTYRTKKASDNTYWFHAYYPSLDAAKEAYREFCSERLSNLSVQFARTAAELAQVDALTE